MGKTKTPATQLTLRKLRAEGWELVEVVERWDSFSRRRHDLFGIVDVLAIRPGRTLAVQTTSFSNSTSRRRKALESDSLPQVIDAGWEFRIHGWKKVGGRWRCHRDQRLEDADITAHYAQLGTQAVEDEETNQGAKL